MVVISCFPPPTEGIRHAQPNTKAIMGARELGSGTLYIAESRLSWMDTTTNQGFSVEYPHICLHAVSRDLDNYPHECLYVMLDANIEDGPEEVNGDKSEDDDEEANMTEIRFIPEDKTSLENMYRAMVDCQALHPDPSDSMSEERVSDEEFDEEESDEEANGFGPCGDMPKKSNSKRGQVSSTCSSSCERWTMNIWVRWCFLLTHEDTSGTSDVTHLLIGQHMGHCPVCGQEHYLPVHACHNPGRANGVDMSMEVEGQFDDDEDDIEQ